MYGNGLDMRGHVDSTFRSKIPGGIWLIRKEGGYTRPGGIWEEEEKFASVSFNFSFDNDTGILKCRLNGVHQPLTHVNVQPARWREVNLLVGQGGVAVISDFRTVHINDGKTYLMPDESGQYRDQLEFSDGVRMRRWRVMTADNRPWRNFCRAVVQVIGEASRCGI